MALTPETLDQGQATATYEQSITVAGASTTDIFTWTRTGDLPGGLFSADTPTSYIISGQATTAESKTFTLTANNGQGKIITRTYTLTVAAFSTSLIRTVAGDGTDGFGGDGGAATDAQLYQPYAVAIDAAGDLFIADKENHCVRKVDSGSGSITTVAGQGGTEGLTGDAGAASSALLKQPQGLAFDSDGNLYISEAGSHRVRKVTATGGVVTGTCIISTFAGDGSGVLGYAGDGGLATGAQFFDPRGIALDSTGNAYIADNGNQRVRKVDATTGNISTFAGTGAPGFAGDGGAATAAGLHYPTGLAFDSAGHLYIAEQGSHRVRKVAAGTLLISTVAGNGAPDFSGDGGLATSAALDNAVDVAFDADDNMYIVDQFAHRIRKVDATSGIIDTIAGSSVATGPGTSGGYDGDNGEPADAEMAMPGGICIDATGLIFIADTSNHRIRAFQLLP